MSVFATTTTPLIRFPAQGPVINSLYLFPRPSINFYQLENYIYIAPRRTLIKFMKIGCQRGLCLYVKLTALFSRLYLKHVKQYILYHYAELQVDTLKIIQTTPQCLTKRNPEYIYLCICVYIEYDKKNIFWEYICRHSWKYKYNSDLIPTTKYKVPAIVYSTKSLTISECNTLVHFIQICIE